METEQQQEHAALQNSLTTPAPLSALEKLPTEVIVMIGTEVGLLDFMVATLVSKHLRSVLLPQRFKQLKLSGSLKKLAHDMRSFLSGDLKHLMTTILSTLKSVTIRFEPYSRAEESTDSHLSAHRIAVISEFISKLSSVNLISFDNQIKGEIDFAEGLGNTPKWNGPKAVIFCGRRNLQMFSALINQFAQNTLKSVEIPRQTAYRHPLALQSACPLLKGLKVDVSSFKSSSRTLACMSSKTLQVIDGYFPHLESLIFHDMGPQPFICRKQLPNVNDYVEKLITQLKSMPRLRRFAFTLLREWLCMEYDCLKLASSSSRDESDDAMQVTPEPNEWPYWLPADAQKEWWSQLITRILEAVPQLQELCIVHSQFKYHRGTKTESIVTVRQEEISFVAEPSRFPYVLADID
ncbi:hypothetical protein FNYG_00346 [Fusarium nygamai]|uniref:F-box domain-containing protein n=1 Tax=Gibberella nygamai TaxID=42673 RepID=A0A2K0WV13_GIBNY|nr:hypothetical protein FNYG_00346 [Fusarium nygamai]